MLEILQIRVVSWKAKYQGKKVQWVGKNHILDYEPLDWCTMITTEDVFFIPYTEILFWPSNFFQVMFREDDEEKQERERYEYNRQRHKAFCAISKSFEKYLSKHLQLKLK